MATARLNGDNILDMASFHSECKTVFGFPEFYGNNLDAWVDCLSYLRDDEGMSKFKLADNEILTIEITHSAGVQTRLPELLEDLSMCIDLMNERYEDYGENPALALKLA
jgi:hypothetical protein